MSVAEKSDPGFAAQLRSNFGQRVATGDAILAAHSKDESYHESHLPSAVAFPQTEAEVVEFVRFCADRHVPIIPFGTGTSLEGQVAAVNGGLCIDLSNMKQILRVSQDDLDCTVEPGTTRRQLNEHLRDMGLFFPVDPGADASLGGMASTRASGTTTVRYGSMRENVLSVKAVLANGKVIRTARRARKSAAGYDLTRLFVGAEGTLGIITELTLRLYGIPESTAVGTCTVASIAGAVEAVIQIIQLGIPIARIELADELQMQAINKYSGLQMPEATTIWVEFHGSPAAIEEQRDIAELILASHGAEAFSWATTSEDRTRLWKARHDAAYANRALRPGCQIMATDVCVPISRLAECIEETQADVKTSFLLAPLVGHVGDGNFHLNFVLDPKEPKELAEANRLNARLIDRALRMDGTCTGEHGVGYGKMEFLLAEHGGAVDVMRGIKRSLDPHNIMNPGKIFNFMGA